MSRDNRIVWNEGMFLGPHHFQQWDGFNQGESGFRQETLAPYWWGIRSLDFDLDALGNKRLKLEKIEAVFPDGALVRAPSVDPLPSGRQLEDYFTPDLNLLEVFLAVPDERPGVALCRAPGDGGVVESRYVSDTVQVEDRNNPGREMEIIVARENLKLMVTGENFDGYVTLKLAEIERGAEGKFVFVKTYSPPALSITAAGPLPDVLASLREVLIAKSTALASQTRQRGEGMVEFGTSDVGNFWLLHTVNSFLPLVIDHEATPARHPHAVYATLAQLAGALCTFGVDRHPREIPPYDHADIGGCMGGTVALIRKLLETVMPSRFTAVGLSSRDETMLTGEIVERGLLEGEGHWYLAVSGEMPEARVRDEVPSQMIIGSPHNVDFLVKTATPGVVLTHVSVPPRDFPLKAGHTYFKLDAAGETWDTIRESGAIAIYLGGPELRTCSFELIVMK